MEQNNYETESTFGLHGQVECPCGSDTEVAGSNNPLPLQICLTVSHPLTTGANFQPDSNPKICP